MKQTNEDIMSKTFLTMQDLYELLPVGKNQASKIFRSIEEDCKKKEIPLFITRPRVIPAEMLFEKYPYLKRGKK